MSLRLDIHLHTRRHSGCSGIDEHHLIRRALRAGLGGIVITEHHYQWGQDELDELAEEAGEPGFLLLAGFEFSTRHGDILVYGLEPEAASLLEPFQPEPEEALDYFQGMGATCIAAHPTRNGMGFGRRIAAMPFDAIEVRSCNLTPREQRIAVDLAQRLGLPGVAASDAHALQDVGMWHAEFERPIQSMADLRKTIKQRRFRIIGDGTP